MIERWPIAALDRLRWRDCFDPHSCPLFGYFAKDNIVLLVHKSKVGKRLELRNHECVICFLMLIFGSKCCKLIRWYHPAREIFNIASCYAELITEIKIEANTVALGMC